MKRKKMKKMTKKFISLFMIFAMLISYFAPLTTVDAVIRTHGEGTNFITMGISNDLGFTLGSVTVNSYTWTDSEDEFHTTDDQYHIIIHVSKNESTGDKIPAVQYGGNWNDYMTSSSSNDGDEYTFVLDLNNTDHQQSLNLSIVEQEVVAPPPGNQGNNNQNQGNQNQENQGNPDEPHFDGRAVVVWSCGSGVCYHAFDNIPNFDDGNSTFYKNTEVVADNKAGVTFDVNAKYKGWYLTDELEEWVTNLYPKATGKTLNWDTLDPELILGSPNQHIDQLEKAAIDAHACTKPAENASGDERDNFEKCINLYAAEHDHEIWTHQLQPVGEPQYKNCFVSYGDRNFKVVIYNENYKGVAMGDLSELNYYPAEWTNPFVKRDQFDISGSTKEKPAELNAILLEKTVRIKALNPNSFEIKSMEALDVPAGAVTITKDNGEFKLVFSSNFYDNVVFKVTDTEGGISYIQVKRYTIDGWIRMVDNHPVLTAEFYFDRNNSYSDFDLTAKIVYKDGTFKNVKLTASNAIDDGLGNITNAYEIDEQDGGDFGLGGKGLKKSVFEFKLEDGEDKSIQDVYLNAEYKGSTPEKYAGAYVGSGKGTLANIYHGEEE